MNSRLRTLEISAHTEWLISFPRTDSSLGMEAKEKCHIPDRIDKNLRQMCGGM